LLGKYILLKLPSARQGQVGFYYVSVLARLLQTHV